MGNKYQHKEKPFPGPIAGLPTETHESPDQTSDDNVQRLIHQLKENQTELEMQNVRLRRAQLELEESRNKYAELYDFAPVGYFTLNEKCIILGGNLAGASLLGIEREKLIKKAFSQYVSKESYDSFYYYRKRLLETKTRQACELRMLRKDGTPFHAHLEGSGIFNHEGNFSHFIITILDITQQKRLEEELRESEKQYKDLFQNSPTGIYRTTPDGRILMANPALIRMLGYSSFEELASHNLEKEGGFQPVHYRKHFKELLERKDEVIGLESEWTKLDGTSIFIRENARVIRGEDGAVLYYEGTVEDITGRKRMEVEIHEGEERFRSAFGDAAIGMALVGTDGRFLQVNRVLSEILGYSEQELLTMTFQNITHPSDLEPDLNYLRLTLAGHIRSFQMEKRYIHKQGHLVWALLTASLVHDSHGNPLYFVSQVQDITERKQAEEALRESLVQLAKKNRYEAIISTVTRSVHQSINLQDVLKNAVEAMGKNIDGADNVSIYLVEGEEAVLKAYRGYPEWFIKRVGRIPYPKGFTWKTIIDRKSRYCADAEQDTFIGPAGREMGTKSYASMPINHEDKTVGCININSLKKNAFDEEELKLLGIVAQQIEIAINNARQAEALHKAKEGLELRVYDRTKELIDINKELTREIMVRQRAEETLRKRTEQVLHHQRVLLKLAKMDNSDLDSALKKITEADAKTLSVERVSVWHYSQNRSEIICKDLYKLSEGTHESGLRLKTQDYPNYFRALEESRILAANDARTDPRTHEYTEGYLKPLGITSMMDIPVRVHGKVVGIIGHEHTGSIREWTTEEQDFAASIADMVSLALEASERMLAEEQIKASLKEKEVLLKEIHHRVKNNLQIIQSLLNLQSSRIDDLRTREKLKQSQSRIKSMALIHETLYQSKDFARIDFRKYVKELSTHLFSSYGANSKDIKLSIDADNVFLSIDKAIPCSLIINEILSNALKHGFLVKKKGKIRIALHSYGKGSYGKDNSTSDLCHLIISNNGIKFPEDLDFRNTESIGLQLVCALTDQLKGTIELDTRSGTEFKITFPA